MGQLHDARIEVAIHKGTPPVINESEVTALARQAAVQILGERGVRPLATANMGGEDFSYYLEQVPGCYVRYGAQIPGREGFPAHSSRFDFDENALGIGAAYLATVARIAAHRVNESRSL